MAIIQFDWIAKSNNNNSDINKNQKTDIHTQYAKELKQYVCNASIKYFKFMMTHILEF